MSYTQDTFANGAKTTTFISKGWTVFRSMTRIVDAIGNEIGELKIVNVFAEEKTRRDYPAAVGVFSDDAVLRMIMTVRSPEPERIRGLLCNGYFLSFRKLV